MDFSKIETINCKDDFAYFIRQLRDDFRANGERTWENPALGDYLEAMDSFVTDSTSNSLHQIDFTPSWKLFAQILFAASRYE